MPIFDDDTDLPTKTFKNFLTFKEDFAPFVYDLLEEIAGPVSITITKRGSSVVCCVPGATGNTLEDTQTQPSSGVLLTISKETRVSEPQLVVSV